METEVLVQRPFMNGVVRQSSKTGFFSATDIVELGNDYRRENSLPYFNLSNYFALPSTQEFVAELEKQYGVCKIARRGKYNGGTWVHPFLLLDIALTINPKFKVTVYSWLVDELLKYRNDSGDSYKRMCGALWEVCSDKTTFKSSVTEMAKRIQIECNVEDWNTATEGQLKLREKLQEYVALFADIARKSQQELFELAKVKAHRTLGY